MAASWLPVSISGGNWPLRYAWADFSSSSVMPFSCSSFRASSAMSIACSVEALRVYVLTANGPRAFSAAKEEPAP